MLFIARVKEDIQISNESERASLRENMSANNDIG